jgi:hypothetical protein
MRPVNWTLALVRERSTVTPDGCWLWQMSMRRDGSGQVTIGGRQLAAHRFAYQLAHGAIPDGLHLHHKCGTYRCVNPDHLMPLEQAAHNALHLTKTHCKHGHALTPANLYVRQSGRRAGKRYCRACHLAACRRRYQSRQAVAA